MKQIRASWDDCGCVEEELVRLADTTCEDNPRGSISYDMAVLMLDTRHAIRCPLSPKNGKG